MQPCWRRLATSARRTSHAKSNCSCWGKSCAERLNTHCDAHASFPTRLYQSLSSLSAESAVLAKSGCQSSFRKQLFVLAPWTPPALSHNTSQRGTVRLKRSLVFNALPVHTIFSRSCSTGLLLFLNSHYQRHSKTAVPTCCTARSTACNSNSNSTKGRGRHVGDQPKRGGEWPAPKHICTELSDVMV